MASFDLKEGDMKQEMPQSMNFVCICVRLLLEIDKYLQL